MEWTSLCSHCYRQEAQPSSPTFGGAVSPTSCSAYYNLSAGKAELLNKMKELPEAAGASSEEEDCDLAQKKVSFPPFHLALQVQPRDSRRPLVGHREMGNWKAWRLCPVGQPHGGGRLSAELGVVQG